MVMGLPRIPLANGLCMVRSHWSRVRMKLKVFTPMLMLQYKFLTQLSSTCEKSSNTVLSIDYEILNWIINLRRWLQMLYNSRLQLYGMVCVSLTILSHLNEIRIYCAEIFGQYHCIIIHLCCRRNSCASHWFPSKLYWLTGRETLECQGSI